MKAIIGGKVYTPEKILQPGVILVNDGKIQTVGSEHEIKIPPDAVIIDTTDRIVVPGFIDVHIHGLMGYDMMGKHLADAIPLLPKFGVTSFMATTLTFPRDEILQSLAKMSDVLSSPPKGANCLGFHIEGPHLSAIKPGMSTSSWFYPLTQNDLNAYQNAAGGNIRMITFAPEEGDSMSVIPYLLKNNIVPVIGHSNASFDQVAKAVKLGLKHSTHTYNAMRALNHREPGTVGGVMYFKQIFAELIADGIHVHPAAMDILIRTKGLDRIVLISDSSPFGGMPEGEYEWEYKPLIVKNGICKLANGTIAGAHALIDSGVRNLVKRVGLPLEKALVTATMTPAISVGLKDKGRLVPGFDADIVILNNDLNPIQTIIGGEVLWSN